MKQCFVVYSFVKNRSMPSAKSKDAKIIETKMLVFGTKDDKCAIRALSQSPKVSHCLELRSQQSMLVPLDDNYMTLPSRHTGFEASYPSRRNKAKYKYL
mmetsp:Transcript_90004/g.176209  ORF Transcript_90004/g.176209 Transcript_90004/m.176209 type:complete len:99 (-) Transcript_90004:393-689(-)